jgi:hypothetical protein
MDLNSRFIRIGMGVVVTLVISGALVSARTGVGADYLAQTQAFLTFYAGVISLVSLTITVALGLLASERVVLRIGDRVRAQFVHRGFALLGVGFLVTHIGMKIAAGLVPPYGSVIPTTNLYVGMGAVASDLMIVVVATGVMRGRFAQADRPWVWRIVHDFAYVAWPIAILHGLAAGRAPAAWVSWSYIFCLVAVGAALLLRIVAKSRPVHIPMLEETGVPLSTPLTRPQTTPAPQPQPVPQPVQQPVQQPAAAQAGSYAASGPATGPLPAVAYQGPATGPQPAVAYHGPHLVPAPDTAPQPAVGLARTGTDPVPVDSEPTRTPQQQPRLRRIV